MIDFTAALYRIMSVKRGSISFIITLASLLMLLLFKLEMIMAIKHLVVFRQWIPVVVLFKLSKIKETR